MFLILNYYKTLLDNKNHRNVYHLNQRKINGRKESILNVVYVNYIIENHPECDLYNYILLSD